MSMHYLGRLPKKDHLHGYLQYDIQPLMNGSTAHASYRVFRLHGSNDVYLYEDRDTGAKIVGKFFLSSRKWDSKKAFSRLTNEFNNLCLMRDYGMAGYPHHVVRPLGRNYSLNALLVTEYCGGETLSEVIQSVLQGRDKDYLYGKLTALAYFLSAFHNRTAFGVGVDFNQDCDYMDLLINRLF